ncbi:glycoside hydrolase [Dentipellis sp. KUC8613]|nr:glycoside hydrolase [Dentipellis sp. KUC8613]
MPRVPAVSPATGNPTSPNFIHTIDGSFVDSTGRTLLFRGVNLSGSSKAPVGEPSYILNGFWDDAEAEGKSFIGRPLNVDDGSADLHLARLRGWGFNVLRYPVTWESLEHEGPGQYDYEFMDYTIRVLRKCKEYGFKVYIDPHQDIWSRFSGGSGAPYWTLPACGIDPRNFTATQAAILHCEYPLAHQPDPATLPAMIWSTNYGRLASQTLFTLFFAGSYYAPKCILDGQNIQDYLQSHYVEAFGRLADRIRDAGGLLDECVIGWDSMNEPAEGFIGYPDLNELPQEQGSTLKKGTAPTPAQSLRLGMGQPQTVEHWAFNAFGPRRDGTVTIDPKGRRMWADPETEPGGVHPRYGWHRDPEWLLGECIWAQHGIWDVETGFVMRPDYFRSLPDTDDGDGDRDVAFIADLWRPHWQAYAARIRVAHPEGIQFVAPPVFAQPPPLEETDLRGRCCYSTHYYDGLTLVTRHWNWFNADALGLLRGKYRTKVQAVKIGESAIRKSLQEQLGVLKSDAEILGAYPTIIGEIGIPYDMDKKRAYGWTDGGKYKGDYSRQQRALDASLNAADGPNALSYSIWTYCPDGSHAWGDGWNMEDLSLWTADDLRQKEGDDIYAGNLADKSSALLLRQKGPRWGAAATSVLSLSSLPIAGAVLNDETRRPEITDAERWENAYDFLTDGARAVKAFSRPYPVAVVGVPTDIHFDIAKTTFKLRVRVRAQDAPVHASTRPGTPSSLFSLASTDVTHQKHAFPATEIFLPIVHYASDRTVGSLLAGGASDSLSSPIDDIPSSGGRSSETLSAYPPARVHPALSPPHHVGGLAADVRVSDGRWEMEGAILKWWYPVPAPGEPDKEYTIEVTRRGGRIWTVEERARLGLCGRLWGKLRDCFGRCW